MQYCYTVVGLCAVVLTVVISSYLQCFADIKHETSKISLNHETNATSWLTPFTTSELRYVLYGEGNNSVSSRDERYLNFIRSLIAHPSPEIQRSRTSISESGFASFVDRRLREKRNGFFVECGANDGRLLSNTLFLESERGWSGLLIEANSRLVKELVKNNRRAYVFGGCLSPYKYPATLSFKSAGAQGGLPELLGLLNSHINLYKSFESMEKVYCVTLGDLLASLKVDHVDFLSLDVQGAEVSILKTIDLTAIRIDIIIAEATYKRQIADMITLFNDTGLYRYVGNISTIDLMFERIDLE